MKKSRNTKKAIKIKEISRKEKNNIENEMRKENISDERRRKS